MRNALSVLVPYTRITNYKCPLSCLSLHVFNFPYNTFVADISGRSQDTLLGSVNINGHLNAGASYNMSLSVLLPERIYGMFYILVETDATNRVYEHAAETDNVGLSTVNSLQLQYPMEEISTGIASIELHPYFNDLVLNES